MWKDCPQKRTKRKDIAEIETVEDKGLGNDNP